MADPAILKELQYMELEMANALLAICSKNNLKIWADSGTLLGAIRHGGFIPWDDDMDFVMFRDDYDKLRELLLEDVLPKPYYFMNGLAQLRICYGGTTMFALDAKYPNHKGAGNGGSVWIDIFCLDNLPMVDNDFRNKWRAIFEYDRIASNKNAMSFSTSKGVVGKCWHLFCVLFNSDKRERKVEQFCKQFSSIECDTVSKLALYLRTAGFKDANRLRLFSKQWYDETVFIPFETSVMPCPRNYDSVLRTMYGDNYMTPIHESSVHGDVIIDLNRPYEVVVDELLSAIPRWKRFWYKY